MPCLCEFCKHVRADRDSQTGVVLVSCAVAPPEQDFACPGCSAEGECRGCDKFEDTGKVQVVI